MADPFSVFAGALGIADVCFRVGRYLREIQKTAKHVPDDLEALRREIDTFSNTYVALESLCSEDTGRHQLEINEPSRGNDPSHKLWTRATELVLEARTLVEKLEKIIADISGDGASSSLLAVDNVRKAIKILSKTDETNKIRDRLTRLNLELNMILTALNLVSNSQAHSKTHESLEQLDWKLSEKLQELGLMLKQQIDVLEKLNAGVSYDALLDPQKRANFTQPHPSIVSAKAAVDFASLSEHFYVQKPDTSIWTGRKKYLDMLRDAFLSPSLNGERVQKRFVVYGIPGAGKTQFCCKFAQDCRESFWGIFWIDASSEQNARESWKKIATIGRKDPNDEAGKHWLANLQAPWLLIIDSADSSEDSIKSQLPSGNRGCILITTRNPRLRIHGTVGSLPLDRLEEDEANELLRKATKHTPWDISAVTCASSIAQRLHYLPLALIHAGRAIFHQLCTLQGYIPFFNNAFENFRKTKLNRFLDEDDDGMGAFTTFDIIYSGLEAQANRQNNQAGAYKDAVELINVFAFMHSHDIKLDIFMKAGKNLEQGALKNTSDEEPKSPTSQPSLLQRVEDFIAGLVVRFMQPVPALPRVLRELGNQAFSESRLRKAVGLLVQMSLISESSEIGSYSMHPLVHGWVRKRLSTSEQALWCGCAGQVLASSIKLPPMTDETGDKDLYVRLLPHIDQVRSYKEEINNELLRNSQNASYIRILARPVNRSTLTTVDVLNLAKYSRVYMECSKFSEAEELQRLVRDFVVRLRGPDHPMNIPILMALSQTLWLLTRAAEAQELQEDALRICQSRLGEKHSQTLKAMDALGETKWQRGWLKEAKALHQTAIDGMEGRPELKRDRLKAMTHLGHVHEWNTEYEQALRLHKAASQQLTEAYGPDDFDTLVAKDSLAMTLYQMGGHQRIRQARDVMQDVHDRRLKSLGSEHLFTLWAAGNLARTLAMLGSLENDPRLVEDAKLIYHDGLEILTRNLGPNHLGTLMGRSFLAETFVIEKSYDKAEREYKDIAERQKSLPGSRAGTHRDRLATLMRLVDCYEVQGRLEEAERVCSTVIEEIIAFGGHEHAWRFKMEAKREKLSAGFDASTHREQSVENDKRQETPILPAQRSQTY